jgi:threonine/homoserine/homoserine lactone efflux protein
MGVLVTALLTGASLGLSIAAPIGPTSLLCIQRTLAGGLPTGLATGLGVATVHLTYGTLATGWGAGLPAAWSNAALPSLVSGAVLLAVAIRVLRRVAVLGLPAAGHRSLVASYGSAIGLALPVPGSAPLPLLAAGVFLGSFGWWITLNTAVALFRRGLTSRTLNRMNRAAGLLLAVLALSLLARGLSTSLAKGPASGMAGESAAGLDRASSCARGPGPRGPEPAAGPARHRPVPVPGGPDADRPRGDVASDPSDAFGRSD